MNEREVKELIGDENWDEFEKWICGQTVGIDNNGEINYYQYDVMRFWRRINND